VHRLTGRDRVVVGLMIGIPLLLDLAFIWGPAISTVFLSFTDAHSVAPVKWTGGANYTFMRKIDPQFWPAVRHNVIWLVEFIVIATPLGMLLAVLLDRGIKGSRLYQSIFFLPVMLSLALIGIIWQIVYSQQYGLINGLLHRTSTTDAVNWLGDPKLNLWAVLVEATWRQAGYVMVLYLAGLRAFDPELREAAIIDGANAWQTFWLAAGPGAGTYTLTFNPTASYDYQALFQGPSDEGLNGDSSQQITVHVSHICGVPPCPEVSRP